MPFCDAFAVKDDEVYAYVDDHAYARRLRGFGVRETASSVLILKLLVIS